jgi:succinoglycan biosynthesis transport protein ExoP
MASPDRGLTPGKTPSSALPFWNRVHRYRCMLLKYWWILALTLSLAICAAAAFEMTRPAMFMSVATLTVDTERRQATIGSDQGASQFNVGLEDFVASAMVVMANPSVVQLTAEKLQAQHPGETGAPVNVVITARNNLVTLTATGTEPVHTQHYLEARLLAYLSYRANQRGGNSEETLNKVTGPLKEINGALQADNAAIIAFRRDHHYLDKGTSPNGSTPLTELRQKLGALQDEQGQLEAMTPEQGFEHGLSPQSGSSGNGASGDGSNSAQLRSGLESSSAESDYRMAQAHLVDLQAQLDDFSRDMQPKHPKIIALNNAVGTEKKHIASLLEQNRVRIQNRLALVKTMILTTQGDIKTQEPKELDNDLLRAQLDTLVEQKQRDLKTFDDLESLRKNASLTNKVNLDEVEITGHASPPEPVPSGWLKAMAAAILAGLISGIGILFLIDRMDDRMGSISDFQQHFSEHVMGQIPRDPGPGNTELLKAEDDRHMLVESFRNLRSTLLFMPLDGQRPKTLLITSAIPNEGKSTISCNLALVLAFAGMKTLLIDADLRRGAIHSAFGLKRDPGLTDVLRHNVKWEDAVRTTGVENLHVLPRGRNVPQPSEYLLSRSTDVLIQELYSQYDYIIIDSSPILAADDTASLAPKIDATLFVVRLSFTSAKLTRKSLEILYNRQANIPGLILNQVDTSSPEFVYYQYSDYYGTAAHEEEPAEVLTKTKTPPDASEGVIGSAGPAGPPCEPGAGYAIPG